jgi:CrcB protein
MSATPRGAAERAQQRRYQPRFVIIESCATRRRAGERCALRGATLVPSIGNWIGVGAGAAAGGVARYAVAQWFGQKVAPGFPWGTLFINVTGSAFIGFFATFTGQEGRLLVAPQVRLLVMTGICGGYTTFSSFSLETLRLMQDRQYGAALANACGSVCLCLIGVWLGHLLATMLNPR